MEFEFPRPWPPWLARDLPEMMPRFAMRTYVSPRGLSRSTCRNVVEQTVRRRGSTWPPGHGMQGVRGSNPLSSTPGQRPSPASTAPDSPTSGSRRAAICVARPIRSSDGAGCCRCRRPGSPGPAGGRRQGRFSWLRRLLWPHRVSQCGPAPRSPTRQRARIWPRPAHQFHPPGRRAWQPVARLELSPAAKSDGRESARTADPCGFWSVVPLCSGQQAR